MKYYKRRISLKEIEDDDSPYMKELVQKFLDQYGDKLTHRISIKEDIDKS